MSILEKSQSPMHHDATHKNLVRRKNAGKLGRLLDMVFLRGQDSSAMERKEHSLGRLALGRHESDS